MAFPNPRSLKKFSTDETENTWAEDNGTRKNEEIVVFFFLVMYDPF